MVYCLRTLYDLTNLGFPDPGPLVANEVAARLVSDSTLPTMTIRSTGTAEDGKTAVKMQIVNRKYQGNPLLLEVCAANKEPDHRSPNEIRVELEKKTSNLIGTLSWSAPQMIGLKLGDALFRRSDDIPDDSTEWEYFDVTPFTVGKHIGSLDALRGWHQETRSRLDLLNDDRRRVVHACFRWWRYAESAEEPTDRLIAYWIIIECIAKDLTAAGRIGARWKEALAIIYPQLCVAGDCSRTDSLGKVLYEARNLIVHEGQRDFADEHSLLELDCSVAKASIEHVLSGAVSSYPKKELLLRFGI